MITRSSAAPDLPGTEAEGRPLGRAAEQFGHIRGSGAAGQASAASISASSEAGHRPPQSTVSATIRPSRMVSRCM